jgi:hypothetical protein
MIDKRLKGALLFIALFSGAAALGIVPAPSQQQQELNETSAVTTGQAMNETTAANVPVEIATAAPTNATTTPTPPADNLTQVKDQAVSLLNSAEQDIQEARALISSLEAQIQQIQEQPPLEEQNETEQIITEANDSATDIVDVIEEQTPAGNETSNQTVSEVSNATSDIVDVIEDAIEGNSNATADQAQNATETVVDVVENATESVDNSTTQVQAQSALIRLLTGLVNAESYNPNLTDDERSDLQANLQETIAELAGDLADKISG